jgi:O-antigen/teichoic acid export membrane protein
MAAKSWQDRYWINTLSNYARVVLRLVSGVVLFRLTFQFLGTEAFGFYSLLWSVFGFTVLMDFGLGFTVQRALARASADGNYAAASPLIATVFWTFVGIAVLVGGLAMVGGDQLMQWVQVPPERHAEFRQVLLIFFAFLALGFPCGLFPEMLRGLQRIDLVNWLQIGGLLLNLGLLSLALVRQWSFPLIMLISVATSVLPSALAALWVFPRAPGLSLRPSLFDKASIRGVLSFSLVAYLITFTNLIMARTDQAVISVMLGVALVAAYQAGYKSAEMFGLFSTQLQDALTPAAALLHARGDQAGLQRLLLASTRMTAALCVPLAALCAVYLEPLIRVLTGLKQVDPASLAVGWALLAASLSSLLSNSCSKRIMMMCGWEKKLMWASLVDAGANLVLSLILVRTLGIAGVAIGTFVPTLLIGWLWILPLTARFAGLPISQLLAAAYGPALRTVAAAGAVLALLVWLAPATADTGLVGLAWRGLLVGAVTVGTAWPLIKAVRHA